MWVITRLLFPDGRNLDSSNYSLFVFFFFSLVTFTVFLLSKKFVRSAPRILPKEVSILTSEEKEKALEIAHSLGKGLNNRSKFDRKPMGEEEITAMLQSAFPKVSSEAKVLDQPLKKFQEFVARVSHHFLYSNPLHFDNVPGSLLVENELIEVCLHMMRAPKGAVGTIVAGNSESILVLFKMAKEQAKQMQLPNPNIIVSEDSSLDYIKASDRVNITLRVVKTLPDGSCDIEELINSIDKHTLLVCLSGLTPKMGYSDPIIRINKHILSHRLKTRIHVDHWNGFFSALSPLAGLSDFPRVDFELATVSTISLRPTADFLAPNGAGLLLFRDSELKKLSIYTYIEWNGGCYVTPSLPGSRSTFSQCGTWVVLVNLGLEGIKTLNEQFSSVATAIRQELTSLDDIKQVVKAFGPIIAFRLKHVNTKSFFYSMKKRGWNLIVYSEKLVQFTLNIEILERASQTFVKDVKLSIDDSKETKEVRLDSELYFLNGQPFELPPNVDPCEFTKEIMIELSSTAPTMERLNG